jgi:hypothetical protein
MRPRMWLAVVAGLVLVAGGTAYAGHRHFQVKPREFAPFGTPLITADWIEGIGCPTEARTVVGNADLSAPAGPGPDYTDPACTTGDRDRDVEGLLLSKTGPTANFASAQALITNPPDTITELGWDIRKPGPDGAAGPRGSHCGAGAPRWNIETDQGRFFIGCNSPAATTQVSGTGYTRLRWGASTLAVPGFVGGVPTALGDLDVEGLRIVFDEGYDTGPDNFGLAILDNIDINGVLVGRGGGGDGDDGDDD